MTNFKLENLSSMEKVLKSDDNTTQVGIVYMQKNPHLYIRTYDGSGNNIKNPDYGKANIPLIRKSTSAYADGSSTLVNRTPTPREISNNICKSTGPKASGLKLTDMVWAWGQFLDHEIDLTPTISTETANMTTPGNDVYPGRTISFERSVYKTGSNPREQTTIISSFIDASNVYGSADRTYTLRKLDNTGEMKTTTANNTEIILPYNTTALANAAPSGSTPSDFFIAGDIRANENILLTAMHILFVREHNRLCKSISISNPLYEEEQIFQKARRQVIAMMQQITFNEFLPALLGTNISTYGGYKKDTDPRMATEFSTVGYRLGHSMLSSTLNTGSGTIPLRNAYFNPSWIQTNGANGLLSGASTTIMQEIDNEVVDDIRDFLFGPPTAQNILDLASLNIQRARDHGIPDYNTLRTSYGLTAYTQFSQITSNATLQTKLQNTYTSINGIDPWVGALCEDHVTGCSIGPLLKAILIDQFERLRDGDRFWWENDVMLDKTTKNDIRTTKLSDIIKRNTNLTVPLDVFHA